VDHAASEMYWISLGLGLVDLGSTSVDWSMGED
jgi:hypothetical protein